MKCYCIIITYKVNWLSMFKIKLHIFWQTRQWSVRLSGGSNQDIISFIKNKNGKIIFIDRTMDF